MSISFPRQPTDLDIPTVLHIATVFHPSSHFTPELTLTDPSSRYYDLTNSLCGDASKGDPFVANWAVTSGINTGIPFCQGQIAETLNELGTNQIVGKSRVYPSTDLFRV